MPNYKIFQDFADSARVRIYGSDSGGNVTPLLTDATGKTIVTSVDSGAIYVKGYSGDSGSPVFVAPGSGSVFDVSGTLGITITSGDEITVVNSGSLALFVKGYSGLSGEPVFVAPGSGSVFDVSGNLGVTITSGDEITVVNSGSLALFVKGYSGLSGEPVFVAPGSGSVFDVSGTLGVTITSGDEITVVNSGNLALFVKGYSGLSGEPVFVAPGSGSQFDIKLNARGTLDSGVAAPYHIAADTSGTDGLVWDVLGYNSWTLGNRYSGSSGEAVSALLQMSVIGSGAGNWVDSDAVKPFSGTSWVYTTTNYHVRYARMWFKNTSVTESGDIYVYCQAEY